MDNSEIYLIGVAHILRMKDAIKREILSIAPRAVCVELDNARFYALTHPEEVSGAKLPFYLKILSNLQKKLGENYGVKAGEEMLAAVDAAKELRSPVFFVDDDAYTAVRRMFKEMTVREKLRFFSALLPFPHFGKKTTVEKELKKYEENESAYMDEFARLFPSAKRILIDERNEHMAARILAVSEKYGRTVAVLGDAHLGGVSEIMKKRGAEVRIIRMKDLRYTGNISISIKYGTRIEEEREIKEKLYERQNREAPSLNRQM